MDITINPVSGAGQFYTAPVVTTPVTDTTSAHANTTGPSLEFTTVSAGTSPLTALADTSEYEAAVRQAALSFKDIYAISDREFSIFKDATGKYITRYVSLRDGSVTYVPEPTLLRHTQSTSSSIKAAVRIAIHA